MKNIKNTLLAGAAALALAHSASATTYFRLTGSTANSDATHNAILNVLTNTTLYPGNSLSGYAYQTSALKGSKIAGFHGTIAGIGDVIIKTHFTGSEAGVQATASALNVTWIDDATILAAPVGGTTTANNAETTVPDGTMSDTFQSTSRFAAGATVSVNGTNVTYSALATWDGTNGVTGVVPFKFVATSDAPFSNITSRVALDLWKTGYVITHAFTGNSADTTTKVYATGRDIDSGTRLTINLAIGYGANATIKQYQPTTSGGAQITSAATANGATNNKVIAFPNATINGISTGLYNNGYNSGGNLCKALASSATNYGGTAGLAAIVAYAGVNDADPQTTNTVNPLKELSFDGVALGGSGNPSYDYNSDTNLINGAYSVWTYEHLYTATANNPIAAAIGNDLLKYNSVVKLSSMKVTRSGDGGAITY